MSVACMLTVFGVLFYRFWLLLASFHRTIRVKESPDASTNGAVLTEEQCLMQETVPVYKIAIFLFIQTVRPHSWRMKYSLDSMNATWYREHAPVGSSLEAAASIGAQSPVVPKGSASPPPPSSPHRAGLPDRSTSDGYYLEFVREKLDDLFTLLYPSLDMMKEECNTMISADMIDLLGFLLCVSDINMVDVHDKLSTSYTKWQSVGGETSEDFQPPRVENGLKLCRFFKRHLALNETLYPPTGFTLGAAAGCSPFALNGNHFTAACGLSALLALIPSALQVTAIARFRAHFRLIASRLQWFFPVSRRQR